MNLKNIIKLYKILGKNNIELEASLKEYSSFKIGGVAHFMFYPSSIKMAIKLLKYLTKNNINFIVLGNATNVLINGDKDVVISLKKLNKINVENEKVFAESGVSLFKFNEVLCENSLTGLERTYGIPGSVGGGVVQNCGAFGASISDNLTKVYYFNGKKLIKARKNDLTFSYRTSEFKNHTNYVVLCAEFLFKKDSKEKINKRLNEIIETRKSKQPYDYPSAGSVFKRVDGVIISKLIDELGLKGKTIGGAMISEKHAGFIINYNNASFDDVINLIDFVKNKIKDEKNIDLELEIVIL